MKKYYLLIWNKCWADEFYTSGFDIIDEILYNKVMTLFVKSDDNDELSDDIDMALTKYDYGFGTNEGHDFSVETIREVFEDAIVLTEKEYQVFNKVFGISWDDMLVSEGLTFTSDVIGRLQKLLEKI